MTVADLAADGGATVAGRYRRDFLLGRGGMGTVWAATDLVLHRWVALKAIDPSAAATAAVGEAQVLEEAKAAARLGHPGVVTVHDVVDAGGELVLVTEYLAGGTLADHVRRVGPLDAVAVAALGARLAGGLAAAHAGGVVHADVKPANVLLVGTDPTEAKLGDFGVASVRGAPVAAAGSSLGTPAYLAPERIAGHGPAEPADVYALGATLWFALTGRSPFERSTLEATLEAAVAEPLPACPVAGPAVDLVVRALDRNPLRRPTAAALATAFAALGAGPVPASTPTAMPSPVAPVAPLVAPAPGAPLPRPIDDTVTIAGLRPPAPPAPVEAPPRPPRRRLAVAVLAVLFVGAAAGGAAALGGSDDGGDAGDGDDRAVVVDDEAPEAQDEPVEDEPEAQDEPVEDEPVDAPEPVEAPDPAPPAADGAYVDPQGAFEVVLPAGVDVALDGAAHVTEATDGDLRIAIRWFEDPVDPAAFIAAEEERLADFPGYERVALDVGDEVVWTFAFAQPSDPDRLLHSTGRAFVVDGRTYAVFVRAADPADVDAVLDGIEGTFVATP